MVKITKTFLQCTNGVTLYRKGGRNRERNCCIPRISPPLRFVLRLRLQKVFVGHYGTLYRILSEVVEKLPLSNAPLTSTQGLITIIPCVLHSDI